MRKIAERHPNLVVGVVAGLPFGAIMGVFFALIADRPAPWPVLVAVGALMAMVFGTSMAWATAKQRRGLGGRSIARSVQSALRSRSLPETVDEAWLAGLSYRKRQASQNRWVGPGFFVFVGVLAVAALGGGYVPDWPVWSLVVLAPVLALLTLLSSNRELRAIAELERQLPQRV
jgi:Flp pilus assembly protein TadB